MWAGRDVTSPEFKKSLPICIQYTNVKLAQYLLPGDVIRANARVKVTLEQQTNDSWSVADQGFQRVVEGVLLYSRRVHSRDIAAYNCERGAVQNEAGMHESWR